MTRIERAASLAQQVHTALREGIASGRTCPGQRVMVERVAEQFGVSPTPVREALNRLIREGFIFVAPGGRFEAMRLTPEYVRDTFLARGSLEGHILARKLQPLQVHVDFIRAYSRRHIGDHLWLSRREHRQIVETLASRSEDAARRAMEEHIRHAGDRIAQLINFDALASGDSSLAVDGGSSCPTRRAIT